MARFGPPDAILETLRVWGGDGLLGWMDGWMGLLGDQVMMMEASGPLSLPLATSVWVFFGSFLYEILGQG